jgi:3-oxoadipate enol-lactonase
VKLHHRFDGDERAPVLMLSCSLATSLELWDENVAALSTRYRILRYDQRGHGRSPVPDGPYTVEDLAEDALGLLDELELRRVTFCGLSLGGAVGMALALRAPERIERLILCCTSAVFAPPEKWVDRARVARAEGLEPLAEATLERWLTPVFRRRSPEAVARLREQILATPAEGYAACCEALAVWDARGRLGPIAAETLVVAAAEDPSTPPEELAAIAGEIQGSELVLVPEAAHLVSVEQPAAFAAAVLGEARLEETG